MTVSVHSELSYCMEHLDILQYFPKIVRQGLILSTINQNCPVATCLDIFNERKPVLGLQNVKVKVKVQTEKFRNIGVLP